MEIKYWIVCGILLVFVYFGKVIFETVVKKFNEVISEIKNLSIVITSHTEKLKSGDEKFERHEKILDDHSKRINELEKK